MRISPPNPPMMRIGECGDRFDNQSGQRIKHADLAKHAVAITPHDRYMWCRAPENATKLWNIINDGECGSNMDASIDKYIRGDV